jgi:ubiquinone/menaquinone biosynthesis C-methylase UbiE
MRLLDVATGPGYVAAAAAKRGAVVTGIDFATAMLAEAQQQDPNIDFMEGDAEALPFPNESFDAVTINFGMVHFGKPEQALEEAHRVLRSGGRAAFTVWETPDKTIGFKIILDAIKAHGRLDVPLPSGPPFFRFSDHEESRKAFLNADFIEPTAKVIPQVWRPSSPEEVFQAFYDGAARNGQLLRAQSAESLNAIRAAVQQEASIHEKNGILELPMPAVLVSAQKP